MKHINKILLFIVTTFFLAPSIVNAASATFTVSGPSQGVVGNQLTLTVTVSSSTSLGGWELALQYDKSYLQLSSAPEGANGTHIAGNATSSGTKSKSYTYKFKVLKSGTTTISPTSTDAYGWDETPLSPSNVSKKVTLKTQAEIEASYSSNAYLKSITVGEYALTPEFNKETKEYEVEVENDVETVTISALKEDANASISGTGDKTLIEGNNKFEIVCTAQKGNSITYVVNVTRKELNPIKITINGKEYGILRKKDSLPELAGFAESTAIYQDSEVPALVNDVLNIKVIGLKDDENNIYTYVYDEATSTIKNLYVELITGEIIITPSDFNKTLNGYDIKEVDIKGLKVKGISLSDKQVLIEGLNPLTNETNVYLYDLDTNTFIPFDTTLLESNNKKYETYKLIIIILGVVVILLFGLVIFKGNDKKTKKDKKQKNKPIIDEFKEIEVEDNKDDLIIEEAKKEESLFDDEDEKVSKKELKKKAKEEKKRLKDLEKEEREKIIEVKEEVKEEKKEDATNDDEVDDPLNDEDDFMDFWDTIEIKKLKK